MHFDKNWIEKLKARYAQHFRFDIEVIVTQAMPEQISTFSGSSDVHLDLFFYPTKGCWCMYSRSRYFLKIFHGRQTS